MIAEPALHQDHFHVADRMHGNQLRIADGMVWLRPQRAPTSMIDNSAAITAAVLPVPGTPVSYVTATSYEILKTFRNGKQPGTELRHLMICFDDGPCYEIICLGFAEKRSE